MMYHCFRPSSQLPRRARTAVPFVWVAALLVLTSGITLAQDVPPGPSTRLRLTHPITSLPAGPLDLVQVVLEFAPGAFTPPHTHGGPTFVTVLEGTMTRRVGERTDTFIAGQGWMEPGEVHAAGNVTTGTATVLVTALVPRGVALTTVAASGAAGDQVPGPRTHAQFRTALDNPPPVPFDLHHFLLDFAPGAITPPHTHGGPTFVTVLTGAMVRRAQGIEETFWPGQTWIEPGVPHAAGNRTQSPASVGVSFLVAREHALTHVMDQPRARDGLALASESPDTQAMFAAVWGERAAARWVEEHNAELARQGR